MCWWLELLKWSKLGISVRTDGGYVADPKYDLEAEFPSYGFEQNGNNDSTS